MKKESPAELRKVLDLAVTLAAAGIYFVPVIPESEEHRQQLFSEMISKLEEMEKQL